MLDLKRGPQDPILPIRTAKHPRTTALYADSPTASQNEGLLSQWISSLVNLTTRASDVLTEALRAPPPQPSSSYARVPRPEVPRPKSKSPQLIYLSDLHEQTRTMRFRTPPLGAPLPDSPPPRLAETWGSPPDSPPLRIEVTWGLPPPSKSPSPQPQAPRMVGDLPSTPTVPAIPPQLGTRRIPEASCPSPEPPSTPVPGPSSSNSIVKDGHVLPFRPPIPGAYLSPSVQTPAPKPPRTLQPPQTELRVEAKHNPYYRSMAPPPSPNLPRIPTPPPQPPNPTNPVEPPSSTAPSTVSTSSTVSASPLAALREEVDAAITVAEKKLAGRVAKKVFSRKTARPHIYQDVHKARVLETRKEDQEALVKRLYELERARGYTSDFQTFQGFLKYRELLDGQGIMSSHPSLTDLRRRYKNDEQRRHSHGDDITHDFLERALQRAKETLNGPKPPPPFIPSFEQLRIARRDQDAKINSRIRGPPLPRFLSPEDDAEVSRLLEKRGVVAKVANLQVADTDLSRLRPGTWLNDEIINFYGQLILERSTSHPRNMNVKNSAKSGKGSILNVHYFNSFFFEKLVREGYQKARLAKWTKRFDLFSKDVILIPINHGNSHWTAAAINFRRCRIESFDSMGVKRQDVFDLLHEYVDLEHLNKKGKPFDWTGWIDYCPRDTPQQENGYDCGVFTCQFLEALSRGVDSPFNFSQKNMPYLRRRMILEIARSELLGGT